MASRQGRADAWIGVDLDGTLASHNGTWQPYIGNPIPLMVSRVKSWLRRGIVVKVVTARVGPGQDADVIAKQKESVELWCVKHIGRILPVTCSKDLRMIELWDDKAVAVEANTGKRLSENSRADEYGIKR